jgi:hypothetical protein
MADNRDNMPMPTERELRRGLADLMLETDATDCTWSLDELTSYAQEALAPADRAEMRDHMVECTLCASAIADLRRAFRPTLIQHRSLAGWLGPVLAYLNFRSSDGRRLWRGHTDRCARCRERTERLQTTLSPPVVALTGAACAMLILFAIGMPKTIRAPGDSDNSAGSHQEIPKGIVRPPSPRAGDWPTSVSVLENYLYPTRNEDQIEKYWSKILDDHPDSLAAHEALARIYRQRASGASDPRRKAGWQERAQAESDKLIELANELGKHGTTAGKAANP